MKESEPKKSEHMTIKEHLTFQAELTEQTKRHIKILRTILGGLLVSVGIITVPIPGPWSTPVVLAGLAILAKDYERAERLQAKVKTNTNQARGRIQKLAGKNKQKVKK